MKKFYKILYLGMFFFLLSVSTAKATHIMGGEVTYQFLGSNGPADAPFRYKITLKVYVDKNSRFPGGNIGGGRRIGIYRGDNKALYTELGLFANPEDVSPSLPPGCVIPSLSGISVAVNVFENEINLPFNPDGYIIFFQDYSRNTITNLFDSQRHGNSFVATIPPQIYPNSSPQFSDSAIPFICAGEDVVLNNNAVDPDGDKLIYSFVTAYSSRNATVPNFYTVPSNVVFQTGYSVTEPFGPNGIAEVNSSTGLTKYRAPNVGDYVVVIEIKEYRKLPSGMEVLLGTTRRELTIFARDCPPNPIPVFNGGSPGTTPVLDYTIKAGQALTFNVGASDANNMTISATGDILNGTNGYSGPKATFPTVSGTGSVTGVFNWQTNCNSVGSYSINVKVEDKGCPPKVNNLIYNVYVLPFKAPAKIFGSTTACANTSLEKYYVQTTEQGVWKAIGGITFPAKTKDSVYVRWTGANGIIRFVQTGGICKDSVSLNVAIKSLAKITATPKTSQIVSGDQVTLNATGGNNKYNWVPSTGLNNPVSASPIARPTVTTKYIVYPTGADAACVVPDTVVVNVVKLIGIAGPDVAFCSGGNTSVGSAAQSGFTYEWSPATGLQNPQSAQTTISLTSTAPTINQYILTAKSNTTSFVVRDTVLVRVNPLPAQPVVTVSGPTVICKGDSVILSAPLSAGYTWSNGASTQHIIVRDSGTYAVSVRDANLCRSIASAPTKVSILSLPVANTGTINEVCSGLPVTIGAEPVPGQSYQWLAIDAIDQDSLNNPTLANPVFKYVNGSNSPLTVDYTLKVKDIATGCSNKAPFKIKVNPLPNIQSRYDTTCANDSMLINIVPSLGLQYTWSPVAGLSNSNIANPKVLLQGQAIPSEYSYSLTVSNPLTSCMNNAVVLITVNPKPVMFKSDTVRLCPGKSIMIGNAPVDEYAYRWSPALGLSHDTISNPILQTSAADNGLRIYKRAVSNRVTGCAITDSIYVKINQLPIPDLGSNDRVCTGDTIRLGGKPVKGISYQWSTPDNASDADSLSQVNVANPLFKYATNAATPTKVRYRLEIADATGCTATDTLLVYVFPRPVANAGIDQVTCSNDSAQLGSAPLPAHTYKWTPETGLSNPFIANPKVALKGNDDPANFVYTLSVKYNPTLCANKDSVVLAVNPKPIKQYNGDTLQVCAGSNLTLGSAPIPGYTYKWIPADGLSNDTVSNPTLRIDSAATAVIRTYKRIVTNTNLPTNCTNIDVLHVKINALPLADVGNNHTLCSGTSILLGNTAISGLAYSWSPRTGLSDTTLSNPALTLDNNTQTPFSKNYTLTVRKLATGCQSKKTFAVTVEPLPIADAGTNKLVCDADTVSLGSAAQQGLTYNWSPLQKISDPQVAMPIFTADNKTAAPITEVYTLVVTDTLSQCANTKFVSIVTNPRPQPVDTIFTGSTTVCPNSNDIAYRVKPQTGLTYKWTVAGGTINPPATASAITVNWGDENSNAKVSAIAVNALGCLAIPKSLPIRVNKKLKPTTPVALSPNGLQMCLSDAANKIYSTAEINKGSRYKWFTNDPTATKTDTIFNISRDTITWVTPGIKQIWVKEIGNEVCVGYSDTLKNIQVFQSPTANATIEGKVEVCEQTIAEGYAYKPSLQLPNSTFTWAVTPIAGTPADGASLTTGNGTAQVSINWNKPGRYKITVIETTDANKGACVGTPINVEVEVKPLPRPRIVTQDTILCTTSLAGQYAVNNPTAGSNYKWRINPAHGTLANASTEKTTVDWLAIGRTDTIWLTETTNIGCMGGTQQIVLFDISAVKLNAVSVSDKGVYLSYSVDSPDTYPGKLTVTRRTADSTWSIISNNVAPAANGVFTDTSAKPTLKSYQYNIYGKNRCGETLGGNNIHGSIYLEVLAKLQGKVLTWNRYTGWAPEPVSYALIRTIDGIKDSIGLNNDSTYTGIEPTDGFNQCFRVKATRVSGEVSYSNTICLEFENLPVTYNVFTPNGDNIHETFQIKNLDLYAENTLTIFNRWGREVYKQKDYRNSTAWDGSNLPAGTYFYQLDAKANFTGKKQTIKGYVQIIR